MFQPLIEALPGWIQARAVAYPSDRALTYDELLPLVMAALPVGEPFILLGESFSGPLAVMAAAKRPAGLVGVVLCATFVTSPAAGMSPVIHLFARTLLFRLFPPMQLLKAYLEGYLNAKLLAIFSEVHKLVRADVIAARVRMIMRVDVREQLCACDVPILYIAASKDVVVPRRNLELIQRLYSRVQAITIEAPHMVLQAKPQPSAEAIAAFAASL